jgi:hypothetical protein
MEINQANHHMMIRLLENFNRTISIWIRELDQYTFLQLCAKPSPDRWSLGQMYIHLISDCKYYIEQIKICVATHDHATDEASPNAKTMFLNNDFPDEVLEGSPDNAYIPQPHSKEQLINDLIKLKTDMNHAAIMISESPFDGKTKHPGLNYFSANEWLQFADMHFRHHLRQKKRIDDFLKMRAFKN